MLLDFDACYRAVCSRDSRFDGRFFTAVTTTGIYCRPICPAQTPKPVNVQFYACAAAAEAAGFRACRRCRPETSPGSPEWNVRADLVARALRMIAEGVVDSDGVDGLAKRLAVSPRHLHRELMTEVGAGPLALARTRRAQTARLLIDQTDLSMTSIAFAAGFESIRQFNDTMHASFGCAPLALRKHTTTAQQGSGEIVLRLRYRPPIAMPALLDFFAARAISGVEEVTTNRYSRTVQTARCRGRITLEPRQDTATVTLRLGLEEFADLPLVVQRCRYLFDLDADWSAIADTLGRDPLLGPLVAAQPGLRIPGTVNGFELGVRAILGQQVSVARARALATRLAERFGMPLAHPLGALTRYFPTAAALADADLEGIGLMKSRVTALKTLAKTVARGDLVLDRGADRAGTVAQLQALTGIGPWSASYIALRALGDPDALPAQDLALRHACARLGLAGDPKSITAAAEAWRPWRGYATFLLWNSLTGSAGRQPDTAVPST